MQCAKAKVRRRGTPSACARCVFRGPCGKVLPPGPFFFLSSQTSFNHRHSVHPPPVPVSQLRLPDNTVSMTFSDFHLPFPEDQDGVVMEM